MSVRGLISAQSLLMIFFAVHGFAGTVTYFSDSSWTVLDSSSVNIGAAQTVCLNSSFPSPCPGGAADYGFSGGGWGANLSAIPDAAWIWAPGVTGSSPTGVEFAMYSFTRSISVSGTPVSGEIFVSADDFAAVVVNGTQVGTVGSISDLDLAVGAQSALTMFDILPYLVSGPNLIMVVGQNGHWPSFGGCTNCTYSQNPAAVVFGGTIDFADLPADPSPEPGTVSMAVMGGIVVVVRRWRKRRRQ